MNKKTLGNLALLFGVIAVSSVILEASARVLWKYAYNKQLETHTHGDWDYVDKELGTILLNAGVTITFGDLLDSLEEANKPLGVTNLLADGEQFGIKPDEPVFQVNSHGFKGPEIGEKSGTRIMTIGDSVTFGPLIDAKSYPRWLERESGAEVINAAVYGYNLSRVLIRLDHFLSFEPDIITVLIGWNHTIVRADPRKNDKLYDRFALYRFFYHGIVNRGDIDVSVALDKDAIKRYDPSDPLIPKLQETTFAGDFDEWSTLVGRIKERLPNTKIVALTLPGLFVEGIEPDKQALMMGYPVGFSDNLYAWPVLTKNYNARLIDFARKNELDVIDLAAWSVNALEPRSAFFRDPVHLTVEGDELVGKHLARELRSRGYLD